MTATEQATAPPQPRQVPTAGMTWIPAGELMLRPDGSAAAGTVRTFKAGGFWMDTRPVTIGAWRRFVRQTGYVTVAEQEAGAPLAGSMVVQPDLAAAGLMWSFVAGASWRQPEGPDSSIARRDLHPVTHIAYRDALAYAEWAGKQLPTETEWEYAARGGLDCASYVWGDELSPAGQQMANTWQGTFSRPNLLLDGSTGTTPVASFPANGFGLFDMAGNVWEWTAEAVATRSPGATGDARPPCGIPEHPHLEAGGGRQVVRGGSFLCAADGCASLRPEARQTAAERASASHLGFRCLVRPS